MEDLSTLGEDAENRPDEVIETTMASLFIPDVEPPLIGLQPEASSPQPVYERAGQEIEDSTGTELFSRRTNRKLEREIKRLQKHIKRGEMATRRLQEVGNDSVPVQSMNSDKLLEIVAAAVQQDNLIERVYERRHEVKDEPTVSKTDLRPFAIQDHALQAVVTSPPTTIEQPFASSGWASLPVRQIQSIYSSNLYKKAIFGGFGTAIGVLLVIIIANGLS